MKDCPHTPHCGAAYTRWRCHMRTSYEKAVAGGYLERAIVERLLRKQGLPMTPASKVFKGQVVGPDLFKSEI